MIAWVAGTITVACLAVLAGRWRPWAAGLVMSAAGVLALVLEWRKRRATMHGRRPNR